MADNYLERKMDEYRSGRQAGAYKPRVSPSGARAGVISVKFPPRRVFVTGGASGIGRAIVKAFCDAGCRVAFCDIDTKAGTASAQALGARFYPVDVRDVDALERCIDNVIALWGDIDVLVNNVGVSRFVPLTESTVADFDDVLSVNLRPAFVTTRKLAIHRSQLPAPAYGRVINICSTRYAQSEPGTEAYSASKGALMSLTHALMASMAPLHVTVNAIAPGWIECGDYSSLRAIDHDCHASRRVGRPADIARMCVFLAEPDNDFINGVTLTVDGGMTRTMIYPE